MQLFLGRIAGVFLGFAWGFRYIREAKIVLQQDHSGSKVRGQKLVQIKILKPRINSNKQASM